MSYQPLRRTGSSTSAATPARAGLLHQLATSFIPSSPISAQFYAERLYALDSAAEPAVYVLALTLSLLHRDQEAIWLLRQPVSFQPGSNSQEQDNPFQSKRFNTQLRTSKPAIESSLRCARLYSQACLALGRPKEGRDALTRLQHSSQYLIQPDTHVPTTFENFGAEVDAYVVELEIGRLAHQAGEHERAVASWRKVLDQNVWCWEAIEGLCAAGYPPDIDTLLPIKPKTQSTQGVIMSPPPERRLVSPQPAPLGPSHSSNSVTANRTIINPSVHPATEGLGFFTPSDTASPAPIANPKTRNDKGGLFGFGGGLFKKTNGATTARPSHNPDQSLEEDSSFDASFYQPTTLSFGAALQQANPAASSSLFTPPTLAPATHLIGKRQRGQTAPAAPASAVPVTTPIEEEPRNSRRPVRGVAAAPASPSRREAPPAPSVVPTRRSSRLSREPGSNSSILGASNSVNLGPVSAGMSKSRSSQSQNGSMALRGAGATKKRTKGGAGLAVLSDADFERENTASVASHETSPAPSSPRGDGAGLSAGAAVVDPAVEEAEEYVTKTVRAFGQAEVFGSLFESRRAIEAFGRLPIEQQKSWRCSVGQAKSQLELLEYDKANKAFAHARQAAPHLLESMELYSTLLWHQRNPTGLSFLAQDLMSIAPRSPVAWIASGNVFSHLEDHAAALKCFRRAVQLDEGCVYAYTLSGHECVTLEEWDRASHFFREAIRRDPRHYNAWFGLGNVYLQTGKYRLAEFHFRKAAEINPTNASLVACVGQVLEKLGLRHDALDAYERAVQLAPRSAAMLFKRAKVLVALREYPAAEADLKRIRERAPNEFNVHFLLGKLYKVVGNQREMLVSFGCAQDIEPRMASLIREAVGEGAGAMEVDESREGA